MKDLFEEVICKQNKILEVNNKRSTFIGYIKLFLFVLFATATYFMVTDWSDIRFKISTSILLLVQIVAWIYHARLGDRIAHSKGIIEVNRRHLARLTGEWSEFPDVGAEFVDHEHPYGCDLDIVGKKSLFQFLNTTHTWHGRHALADDLLRAGYSMEQIKQRQESVAELADDHNFASELEYHFSKIGTDAAADQLVEELKDDRPFIKSRLVRASLTYSPLFLIFFTSLIAIFRWNHLYKFSVILLVIQALVWLLGASATFRYMQSISRLPFKLDAYHEVLALLDKTKFTTYELQQIQSKLTTSDHSASQAIKELVRIADRVSVHSNAIVYFILNVLLLWDYQSAFLFGEWKTKYAPLCETWFLSLGELESLLSFATMKKVCNHTCFPVFSALNGAVAKEMGHPMLPNASRITNQLKLNDNILIISGSNMSGKTTYLRTIGINLVLARAGGLVCAKEMECSDLHIITSMRIADNLNDGISTFYAELKRIKKILDSAEHDHNTLFLIDEIFRGTNSVDRLYGAKTVITKLNQLKAIGIVTTHDLELCDLAQVIPRIQNYSFSEYYEKRKICFDYKIQSGKSKTTNAKYLMELIGIIS